MILEEAGEDGDMAELVGDRLLHPGLVSVRLANAEDASQLDAVSIQDTVYFNTIPLFEAIK